MFRSLRLQKESMNMAKLMGLIVFTYSLYTCTRSELLSFVA